MAPNASSLQQLSLHSSPAHRIRDSIARGGSDSRRGGPTSPPSEYSGYSITACEGRKAFREEETTKRFRRKAALRHFNGIAIPPLTESGTP
ncbi:hypothetical protein H6P81_001886 [Aristolochia fimbriata]|uniref:Uncharacterized protein n=1 Tax=Aristolochia fimbriata TaxID=158543 RepID=A0AAV7F8U4_ARIFI|nr:hypothetical protein H6P81_001886 [Aristolochia fimbriata]